MKPLDIWKNKKRRVLIFFILILLLIPCLVLPYTCIKYLNVDNGYIKTICYWSRLKLYEKEDESELSAYMKDHIFDDDNHYLPIWHRKGFEKQDYRNHHCYYELKMYFMECDLEGREISDEKINEIIGNYLKSPEKLSLKQKQPKVF